VDNERELRSAFRRALDAVSPPAPWLRTAVKEKLDEQRGGGRGTPAGRQSKPWLVGLRGAGAVAAVLLIVLLVFTLLVGGAVGRDWQRFINRPAPAGGASILDGLRARPLILPVVPPGATCPNTPMPLIDFGVGPTLAYGDGPVYGIGGPASSTSWGDYFDVMYVADPQFTGIVLVRIRDLESDRVGVFVGSYAAGDVVGTDTIAGKTVQQHAELVLDASRPASTSGASKWGQWQIRQGLAAGWSHCFGIQVDGPGFTEVATGNG
jgi:hypothetical protein